MSLITINAVPRSDAETRRNWEIVKDSLKKLLTEEDAATIYTRADEKIIVGADSVKVGLPFYSLRENLDWVNSKLTAKQRKPREKAHIVSLNRSGMIAVSNKYI